MSFMHYQPLKFNQNSYNGFSVKQILLNFMGFFGHFMGLKLKIQKNEKTPRVVAIWNNHTNFHKNRITPSVQNLVYRQTDTQTDRQADTHTDRHFVKTTFLVSGGRRRPTPPESYPP